MLGELIIWLCISTPIIWILCELNWEGFLEWIFS
jgi:hypothetical protein